MVVRNGERVFAGRVVGEHMGEAQTSYGGGGVGGVLKGVQVR
jgi:hypothetical protein